MKGTNITKYTICAILIVLSVSCAKDKIIKKASVSYKEITFQAYDAEREPSTKTVLFGSDILWIPGDEIMVYQGTKSSGKFTSNAEFGCELTEFTGTLPYIIGSQETDPENTNIWAVYPYEAAISCDGSSVTLAVDAVQTSQSGTFASGIFPAVAKSDKYSLAFYNVCGGVKFTVAQAGIKKVVLKGNNSEQLAGKINVIFSNGLPVVNSITESIDSIIVNAPTSDGFIPGDEYFIVAIPTVLSNGFSITYSNDYDATKYDSSNYVQIKRKTFGVVSRKDTVGIIFRDPVAKAACVTAFDTSKDGEVSFDEANVATTLSNLFEKHNEVEYFDELQYFTSVSDLKGCFTNCCQLKHIVIPSFISTIGAEAFMGCSQLRKIQIPSTVNSIGARAFYGIGATSINIPDSILTIGKRAFGSEAKEIIMEGSFPPIIDDPSFATSTIIFVPNEALSLYKNANNWNEIQDQIEPISNYCADLSVDGTANCYIVNKAGKYKFKATVKGNSTESVGIPKSAAVLWESFGSNEAISIGDIISSVSLVGDYVYFSTPTILRNGNAVIAVKNDDGNIIWSWHIWICKGFDPIITSQTYNNNAGVMMDRNLGALSSVPGEVGTSGLLYQWGRKDPFLGWDNLTSKAVSSINWPELQYSNSLTGTIEYSIANPMVFLYPITYLDWLYTESYDKDQKTRWCPSPFPKSMYDPCPIGWRVPNGGNSGIWSVALNSSSSFTPQNWDNTKKGIDLGANNGQGKEGQLGSSSIIWYPGAGYLIGTNLCMPGSETFLWSCSFSDNSNVYHFQVHSGLVAPTNKESFFGRGESVRCCKE